MATTESTLEIIRRAIAAELDVLPVEVDPARRFDELGLDSLAAIEVLFKLENELLVAIPQDAALTVTVQEMARQLDERLAERPTPPVHASARDEAR
jgi:erythronolide synthase